MCDDVNGFVDEYVVGRDLRVPRIDKLFQNDRENSVELQIDLIGARERRQQFVHGSRCASSCGACASESVLSAQCSSDEGSGGLVRQHVRSWLCVIALRRAHWHLSRFAALDFPNDCICLRLYSIVVLRQTARSWRVLCHLEGGRMVVLEGAKPLERQRRGSGVFMLLVAGAAPCVDTRQSLQGRSDMKSGERMARAPSRLHQLRLPPDLLNPTTTVVTRQVRPRSRYLGQRHILRHRTLSFAVPK